MSKTREIVYDILDELATFTRTITVPHKCRKCGSRNTTFILENQYDPTLLVEHSDVYYIKTVKCNDCGETWEEEFRETKEGY